MKYSKWETQDDVDDLMSLQESTPLLKSKRSSKHHHDPSQPINNVAQKAMITSADLTTDDEFLLEVEKTRFLSNVDELNKMRLSREKLMK